MNQKNHAARAPTIGPRRIATIAGAAIAAAILLSGCNTKPSTSDISRELQEGYDCPLLEITNVNKVDGAPRNDGGYEVAFTYQVNFVGGADKAVPYFYELNAVQDDERNFDTQDRAKKRMAALQPCNSQDAFIALNNMSVYAREDSALPPSKYQIPIAIKRKDVGVMNKTETGWHFSQPLAIDDAVYVQVPAKPVSPPAASSTAP